MKIHQKNVLAMALIVVVTAAVYARSAWCPFYVVDDGDYVINNMHVVNGLSWESVAWAFTAFHSSNWHPLTWLSLMLDSQLFGLNPAGYHLVNVALHAIDAALLFLLFRRMTGAFWRSALVAALFALHPLHVESVVWISERKDVLSALFWMLSLMAYVSWTRGRERRHYLLALVLFALGLMAKPMLVTLPVVMLLLDFWPLGRLAHPAPAAEGGRGTGVPLRIGALLLEKAPFLVLSAASSVVTVCAQHNNGSVATLAAYPLFWRIDNALWSLLVYARKMLFPYDLAVYYPWVAIPLWKAGIALALLCGALWFAARRLASLPWLATGILWFLVTLSPVIGLIQVADQAMADRYSYLPLIGLFTALAWGGAELASRLPSLRRPLAAGAALALAACALATVSQVSYWDDNVRLVRYTLAATPQNFFAFRILGAAYEQQGRPDLAEEPYRAALRINPADPGTRTNLGNLLDNEGRTGEAIREYREAIRVAPHYALGHFNLGLALEKAGELAPAEEEFARTLGEVPDFLEGHNCIGRCYLKQGRLDEAIDEFRRELSLHPALTSARHNLDIALRQKSLWYAPAGGGRHG